MIEEIGTNHQVKDQEVEVDFERPFDILLKFKALQGSQDEGREDIEKGRTSNTPERPVLATFLNEVRIYFEVNFSTIPGLLVTK